MPLSLVTPIERAPRIASKIIPALKRLGIRTLEDLLFHFPIRYEAFAPALRIADVEPDTAVTVQGDVISVFNRPARAGRMILTEAAVRDESGIIKTVWFNQPYLLRSIKPGMTMNFSGRATLRKDGIWLQNPAYERIQSRDRAERETKERAIHTGSLVPMYAETKGISSRWLRHLISSHLRLANKFPDPLPPEVRASNSLPDIDAAIRSIHFPSSQEEARSAKRRLMFEELFFLQLQYLLRRKTLKSHLAPTISFDIPLLQSFVGSLPFRLTDAQRKAIWEIARDLAKPAPMNRLLEGDVGSGKTVVAAAACLLAAKSGFTSAVMAPTEILANQHYQTLDRLLSPHGITLRLTTAGKKQGDTTAHVHIGTHALIQKNALPQTLGLVVIDEQHRFGVNQRAELVKRKAQSAHGSDDLPFGMSGEQEVPHFLSMSATPIPRTLALTVYGDLDVSILDQMPPTRKPVLTAVVEPEQREEIYAFIRGQIKKGRQAFVICPRIEINESESVKSPLLQRGGGGISFQKQLWNAEIKTVTDEYKKLSERVFPDLRIAMLHGRMKPKDKDTIMQRFRDGEFQILVSSSVVEVGVDVPGASVMMIEGAERFGLAQLHQFRGRVGRGPDQAYCFLFPTQKGLAAKRLSALIDAKNGFELAQKDLVLRGPGDLLGVQQSGISPFAQAALADASLLRMVRQAAVDTINRDPNISSYPPLKERLEELKKYIHNE